MIEHIDKYIALAKKYNLDVDVVRKVCISQFEFTKSIIQSGKDEPIRLAYLGLFRVKPGRRDAVKKKGELNKLRKKEIWK